MQDCLIYTSTNRWWPSWSYSTLCTYRQLPGSNRVFWEVVRVPKPRVSEFATVILRGKLELAVIILKRNFCSLFGGSIFKSCFWKHILILEFLKVLFLVVPDWLKGSVVAEMGAGLSSVVGSDWRGQSRWVNGRKKGWEGWRDLRGWRNEVILQWDENQGVLEEICCICQTCLENACLQLCGGTVFVPEGEEEHVVAGSSFKDFCCENEWET